MKNEQNVVVHIYGNIRVEMSLRTWLGVKYLAHDRNGDLYGYAEKPLRKMECWDVASRGDKSVFIAKLGTFTRDWTASCLSVEQILESPANAELAAWEKENNISHPVPEETLAVLLDNPMEAPKQAAEPTACEDTAPDKDTARSADPVNHPEQFEGYCRGNAMKYLWRAGKKVKPGQTVIKKWKTDKNFARLADWAIAAAKEILAQRKKDGADHD